MYQGPASGASFWATGNSVFITMISCRPNSALSGNQGFQVDSGSDVCFIGCDTGGAALTLSGTYTMLGTNFGGQANVIGLPETAAPSTVGATTGQVFVGNGSGGTTAGSLYFLSNAGNLRLIAAV